MKNWNCILNNGALVIGITLTIFSFIYQMNESKKQRMLREHYRAQIWQLIQINSNSNGFTQKALELVKEDADKASIIEYLARSDSHSQALLLNLISHLTFSENNFTELNVLQWYKDGKIQDGHIGEYLRISSPSKNLSVEQKMELKELRTKNLKSLLSKSKSST